MKGAKSCFFYKAKDLPFLLMTEKGVGQLISEKPMETHPCQPSKNTTVTRVHKTTHATNTKNTQHQKRGSLLRSPSSVVVTTFPGYYFSKERLPRKTSPRETHADLSQPDDALRIRLASLILLRSCREMCRTHRHREDEDLHDRTTPHKSLSPQAALTLQHEKSNRKTSRNKNPTNKILS